MKQLPEEAMLLRHAAKSVNRLIMVAAGGFRLRVNTQKL